MSKRSKKLAGLAGAIVPHPRHGNRSLPSGSRVPEAEVLRSYWGYRTSGIKVFAQSAIPADISRQRYVAFPRPYYADILRTCRNCHRPFLFFAREQKYWYEVLGFFVDANCVYCVPCRRQDHHLRQRFRRYSDQVTREDLSDSEFATLIDDAVFLFEAGILGDEQRLRRLKNLALARLPTAPATTAILEVIAEIERRHEVD